MEDWNQFCFMLEFDGGILEMGRTHVWDSLYGSTMDI